MLVVVPGVGRPGPLRGAANTRQPRSSRSAALMVGVPLIMAGGSILMLSAYWREELKIGNERLTFRGIVRRKDIDLRDVTDARWQTSGSSSALRAESLRHMIHFANYNDDESEWIVHHMRSVLRPRSSPAGISLRTRARSSNQKRPASSPALTNL